LQGAFAFGRAPEQRQQHMIRHGLDRFGVALQMPRHPAAGQPQQAGMERCGEQNPLQGGSHQQSNQDEGPNALKKDGLGGPVRKRLLLHE
jgi:hypothetical protein